MPTRPMNPVPAAYHSVNPWIIARGAEQMIGFLEDVFEAREQKDARVPDRDGLIIHSEVKLGDSIVMIFDSKEDWPPTPAFLQVYSADAAAVLERARKAGSEIVTELTDAWYGEKLARFRDPCGNLWWVHERTQDATDADWEADTGVEDAGWELDEPNYIYDTLMEAMRTVR